MAKTGFPYYRAETDRFQDIRIKRLKKEFHGDGYSVYSYILNEIYRVKGCFLEWDESTAFDVSEYWGLKESKVNEIVKYCCAIGLFDKRLFTNGRVITSLAIQSRYIEMSRQAKRTNYQIPSEICLIPEEILKLPEKTPILPEVFDKVKYSKEKNSISPSIPQGKMEEISLKFLELYPPPADGLDRNYEGMIKLLMQYKVPPDKALCIIKLSNYGETSMYPNPTLPFWRAVTEIQKGGIHSPGEFILSKLRKSNGHIK